MKLQMIQEMSVKNSLKDYIQNISESFRVIIRKTRAANCFRGSADVCTLPTLRKSISIKIQGRNDSNFHRSQDFVHLIVCNHGQIHGMPETRRSMGTAARIVQDGIRRKKKAEEIGFFRWKVICIPEYRIMNFAEREIQ